MSASSYDGRSRRPLRVGVAVVAGLQLMTELASLLSMADRAPFSFRHRFLSTALPATTPSVLAVALVALAGLTVFARGRRVVAGGLLALVAMALISQWNMELFGSPSRNFFFPGGVLFGWVAGALYARAAADGAGSDLCAEDAHGEAGAVGVFAALYMGSAATKLLHSGLAWAHPDTLRYLILSQRGLAPWGWVSAYRDALVEHPALAQVFAVATLVIEGGAFMMLVSRRWRVVWGLLIVALHTNIIVLCVMPYFEAMALAMLFAFPFSRRESPADDAPAAPLRVPRAVLVALAALLALAYTLPVGWRPFEGDSDAVPRHEDPPTADAPR